MLPMPITPTPTVFSENVPGEHYQVSEDAVKYYSLHCELEGAIQGFAGGGYKFTSEEQKRALLGGKAYNLACLEQLPDVNIPEWFSVSSELFREYIQEDRYFGGLIGGLEAMRAIHADEVAGDKPSTERCLFDQAKILRNQILSITFDEKFLDGIGSCLDALLNFAFLGKTYAVRSSASIEDGTKSSLAGLFDSCLNQHTTADVLYSIKQCWASTFNDGVIEHCLFNNIPITDLCMAVVVQRMVDAKISGTTFNVDLNTNTPMINIYANYGVGGIVDGETTGDAFVVNPNNLHLIKRSLGSKDSYNAHGTAAGVVKTDTPESQKREFCLSDASAKLIAKAVWNVGQYYKMHHNCDYIDMEFAIDVREKVYMVQARPVIMSGEMTVIDPEQQESLQLFTYGHHAVFGVASGKVKIVENFDDLESGKVTIDEDDILVAHRSANYWTPYLTKFKGIITIEGSPTAHPMLIARERGKPCVIGVPDAIKKLRPYEGQYITLDGSKKAIYLGRLDESAMLKVSRRPDCNIVSQMPEAPEEEIVKDLLARGRLKQDADGYWLVNPDSKLSGAVLDVQEKSHAMRIDLINKARHPENGVEVKIQTRIMDDKVYVNWEPIPEQQKMFGNMDIDECERYFRNYQASIQEYIDIGAELEKDPTAWKRYLNVMTEYYAYMWTSYMFQTRVRKQATSLGNKLEVPTPFFEEYLALVQKNMAEEDLALKSEALEMSTKLKQYCLDDDRIFEELELADIQKYYPDVFDQLGKYARKYKFTLSEDFYGDPPLRQAYHFVKNIPNDYQPSLFDGSLSSLLEEYFVEDPELKRWMELMVQTKVVHNNAHHARIRHLWVFRDFLLEHGERLSSEGKFNSAQDILKVSCDKLDELLGDVS